MALTMAGLLSACATTRSVDRNTCALIGGAIGGVKGLVVVNNNDSPNETDEKVAGAVIGAAAGALIGYLICGDGAPAPAAAAPEVSISATPSRGAAPLDVAFASSARDADGRVVRYAWDFGDGGTSDIAQVNHTYARPGSYRVRLTVTDDSGLTGTASGVVEVTSTAAEKPLAEPSQSRRIVLQGITFAFDSAQIPPTDAPILDVAVEQLQANRDVRVKVVGHTDSVGADDYNQRLSDRRAKSVVDYLTRAGVSASRLQSEGQGERNPVASNDTADGRAQNRRVELEILP